MDNKYKAMLKIILWTAGFIIILKLCLIFLSPFVTAVFLTVILEPFVRSLCKIGIKRSISVIIGFAILVIIIGFVFFYMFSYIYEQLRQIVFRMPEITPDIINRLPFLKDIPMNYELILGQVEEFIPSYKEKIVYTIMNTAGGVVYIFMTVMITLYLSMDLYRILSRLKALLPLKVYCPLKRGIIKIRGIVNAEMILILATTIATIIGLYLLGVKEPLTVGIICGILDIMPIVGPGFLFVPWSIYAIIKGNVFFAIGLVVLFILIGVIRQLLEVKFVGDNLNVHPVTTLFSIYTGVLIYGVWGFILGPVIIMIVQELLDMNFEGRKRLLI